LAITSRPAGAKTVAKKNLDGALFKNLATTPWKWFDNHIIELFRQLRLSYLPPLMVYLAAGISGLTGIVGTFFVKDYLGLSAEFLAMLGFWAGIPWALKMPLGHLVDLIWRWKSILVFLGATLIGASLAIMLVLISAPSLITPYMTVEAWFIFSALLAPIGYVVQDVVADAMTVDAVPTADDQGSAFDSKTLKLMHTTMQTLGRVAIVGGGLAVSLVNILLFNDVNSMMEEQKVAVYVQIYKLAIIPLISICGVILAEILNRSRVRKLLKQGIKQESGYSPEGTGINKVKPNWWILGGSLVFVFFTLTMGLMQVPYNQEIIFSGSMAIVLFLMNTDFHGTERAPNLFQN